MKKRISVLAILIVFTAIAGYIGIQHVAPYAVLQPPRITPEQLRQHRAKTTPADYGLQASIFDVQVADSILLKGWYIHANRDSCKATIIMLHGIASCKEHQLGAAAMLADSGFNTIIYDSRAHGESGGQFCTYGYYEKHDLSAIIDTAQQRFGSDQRFAVWGNSFGGAVALQAMAVEPRIHCGIVESTFAAFPETARDYMARVTGIGFRFISDAALQRAGELADFQPFAIHPALSARKISQPILLIHGDADEKIPIEYGRRIFDNLASLEKEWYPVSGADHHGLWQAGGEQYKEKVFKFFRKHLASNKL